MPSRKKECKGGGGRSSAARAFGYQSKDLTRILTAADPEEVIETMEVLGIQLIEDLTFFELIQALVVASVLGTTQQILDLVQDFKEFDDFIQRATSAPFPITTEQLRSESAELNSSAQTLRLLVIREREMFQEALEKELARQTAREIERLFELDPRGELFQQIEGA